MTRSQILALEAGPELDALVAEKVMGWIQHPKGWYDVRDCAPAKARTAYSHDGRIPWKWQRDLVRFSSMQPFVFFAPSTDISAAWEVVEKLGDFKVETCPKGCSEDEAPHVYVEHDLVGHNARTAPLGICHMALIAVMEAE